MFSIDSKFFSFTQTLYRLVVLNLLFILFSLPIITIGASFSALVKTMGDTKQPKLFRPFFETFKYRLFRNIPYVLFNVMAFVFYQGLRFSNFQDSLFLRLLLLIFAAFLLAYNVNIYFVLEYWQTKGYMETFRQAFYLTVLTFYKTFLIPILYLGLLYVGIRFLGPMFVLIMVSLPVGGHYYVLRKELLATAKSKSKISKGVPQA